MTSIILKPDDFSKLFRPVDNVKRDREENNIITIDDINQGTCYFEKFKEYYTDMGICWKILEDEKRRDDRLKEEERIRKEEERIRKEEERIRKEEERLLLEEARIIALTEIKNEGLEYSKEVVKFKEKLYTDKEDLSVLYRPLGSFKFNDNYQNKLNIFLGTVTGFYKDSLDSYMFYSGKLKQYESRVDKLISYPDGSPEKKLVDEIKSFDLSTSLGTSIYLYSGTSVKGTCDEIIRVDSGSKYDGYIPDFYKQINTFEIPFPGTSFIQFDSYGVSVQEMEGIVNYIKSPNGNIKLYDISEENLVFGGDYSAIRAKNTLDLVDLPEEKGGTSTFFKKLENKLNYHKLIFGDYSVGRVEGVKLGREGDKYYDELVTISQNLGNFLPVGGPSWVSIKYLYDIFFKEINHFTKDLDDTAPGASVFIESGEEVMNSLDQFKGVNVDGGVLKYSDGTSVDYENINEYYSQGYETMEQKFENLRDQLPDNKILQHITITRQFKFFKLVGLILGFVLLSNMNLGDNPVNFDTITFKTFLDYYDNLLGIKSSLFKYSKILKDFNYTGDAPTKLQSYRSSVVYDKKVEYSSKISLLGTSFKEDVKYFYNLENSVRPILDRDIEYLKNLGSFIDKLKDIIGFPLNQNDIGDFLKLGSLYDFYRPLGEPGVNLYDEYIDLTTKKYEEKENKSLASYFRKSPEKKLEKHKERVVKEFMKIGQDPLFLNKLKQIDNQFNSGELIDFDDFDDLNEEKIRELYDSVERKSFEILFPELPEESDGGDGGDGENLRRTVGGSEFRFTIPTLLQEFKDTFKIEGDNFDTIIDGDSQQIKSFKNDFLYGNNAKRDSWCNYYKNLDQNQKDAILIEIKDYISDRQQVTLFPNDLSNFINDNCNLSQGEGESVTDTSDVPSIFKAVMSSKDTVFLFNPNFDRDGAFNKFRKKNIRLSKDKLNKFVGKSNNTEETKKYYIFSILLLTSKNSEKLKGARRNICNKYNLKKYINFLLTLVKKTAMPGQDVQIITKNVLEEYVSYRCNPKKETEAEPEAEPEADAAQDTEGAPAPAETEAPAPAPAPAETEAPAPAETEAPAPAPAPVETEGAPAPAETEAPAPAETEAPAPEETEGAQETGTTTSDGKRSAMGGGEYKFSIQKDKGTVEDSAPDTAAKPAAKPAAEAGGAAAKPAAKPEFEKTTSFSPPPPDLKPDAAVPEEPVLETLAEASPGTAAADEQATEPKYIRDLSPENKVKLKTLEDIYSDNSKEYLLKTLIDSDYSVEAALVRIGSEPEIPFNKTVLDSIVLVKLEDNRDAYDKTKVLDYFLNYFKLKEVVKNESNEDVLKFKKDLEIYLKNPLEEFIGDIGRDTSPCKQKLDTEFENPVILAKDIAKNFSLEEVNYYSYIPYEKYFSVNDASHTCEYQIAEIVTGYFFKLINSNRVFIRVYGLDLTFEATPPYIDQNYKGNHFDVIDSDGRTIKIKDDGACLFACFLYVAKLKKDRGLLSPLKLKRTRYLSPTSKIVNSRKKRKANINKLKVKR